jgi:hypothetical protein
VVRYTRSRDDIFKREILEALNVTIDYVARLGRRRRGQPILMKCASFSMKL